jgi:[acyl-carrier-protein] S-malonyltransferase
MAAAKARGAKRAMLLPVSAPFHSSLLAPAAERLARRLADVDFASPRVPVVHNVDVTTHDTAAAMRDALARQAASPMRWTDTMRYLVAHGVTSVVECGPGRVLAGLARRTDDSLAAYSLTDAAALAEARTALA